MLVTQHLCNRLYICHRHIKLRGKGDIQWILQFIQKQLDEKSRIYAPDMKGTIFSSHFLIILSVNLIFVNEHLRILSHANLPLFLFLLILVFFKLLLRQLLHFSNWL